MFVENNFYVLQLLGVIVPEANGVGLKLVSRGSLVFQFGSLVSIYRLSPGATATTMPTQKTTKFNSIIQRKHHKPPHLREPPPSYRVTRPLSREKSQAVMRSSALCRVWA